MANPNSNAVPEPMRRYVRRARTKKFADNGKEKREYKGFLSPRDPWAPMFNAIPTENRISRRGPDGEIIRLGDSTEEERKAEYDRFGAEIQKIFDKYIK